MSEIVITWNAVLPAFFIERVVVGLLGFGMFAHFLCMAAAAPTKSPTSVMAFLMTIVFCSAGMFACAIIGDVESMRQLLIWGLGAMFLFWLWLWYQGMHVKDFLDKKYGTTP